MLETQELYGDIVLNYVGRQLTKGDELAQALLKRLPQVIQVYTFVPAGETLACASLTDFESSAVFKTRKKGWLPSHSDLIHEFIQNFLLAGQSRIAMVALMESEDDIIVKRFNVSPDHVFIERPTGISRAAYIYLKGPSVSATDVEEALLQERDYPSRTFLVDLDLSSGLPELSPGKRLDPRHVSVLSAQTRFLIVGAYDAELKLICELKAQ